MGHKHWIVYAVLGAALAWPPSAAVAQVPPHAPGSVCATPQFWCWALYVGPPGTQCACRSRYGWVAGILI
ncbi:MAG: hypothetical protein JWQ33_505 [Ramlibacter sp.]|nr:hypothetical protein [Ramlibacter sp.]